MPSCLNAFFLKGKSAITLYMPLLCRIAFACLAVALSLTAVNAQPAKADSAVFSFNKTTHDFGIIHTDTVVECRFEFENTGNAMLIINDITLSCPCFSADWRRGPVMPGEKGWVNVRYPSGGKPGPFEKILWIASNASNTTANLNKYELHVKGVVVQREGAAGGPGGQYKKKPAQKPKR
jgi:hypothetical protein